MGYIIDLIALGIIVLSIFMSAKRGFVRTLIEVVGFVVALVLAFSISSPLADMIYNKFLEPPMISAAQSAAETSGQNAADALWSAVPSFVAKNGDKFGLSYEGVSDAIGSVTSSAAVETSVRRASQNVIKPVAVNLLSTLFATILFIVLLIVVKFSAKFVNKLFSFSIIGKLNRNLGGVLGAVKGLIIAFAFLMVVKTLITTSGGFGIFNFDMLESSIVFEFLDNL